MKVRIEIDTKTFVRFWVVLIGFVLVGALLYNARTALIIIATSFFLALALSRPVNLLARHLPGRSRLAGTALAFSSVVLIVASLVLLVVPPILEQSNKIAQAIPQMVDGAQGQWNGLHGLIDKYQLQPQIDSAVQNIKDNLTGWIAGIGKGVVASIGSFTSYLTMMILVLTMTFFMLLEGPTWFKRLWLLYKDQEKMEYHRRILNRMYNVVSSYVTGQLTVSAIGASCAGLAVFLLSFFTNIPPNLAMPVIALTFILSMVPMFGATIAGVISTVLLALNDVPAAIIYAAYFVVYQQIENNFINPTVQARNISLSPLIILISATTGIYMIGILGGIIAIPIAGCVKILIEEYISRANARRVENEKPIHKIINKLTAES